MACLRLFTLPPLPRLPERSVPCFLRRIALATVLLAPLPYLRPRDLVRELELLLELLRDRELLRELEPRFPAMLVFSRFLEAEHRERVVPRWTIVGYRFLDYLAEVRGRIVLTQLLNRLLNADQGGVAP